jgi:hypothetical protein
MARSACTAPEAEGVRQPRGAREGHRRPKSSSRYSTTDLTTQHVAQRMCTLFLPERASTQEWSRPLRGERGGTATKLTD